MISKKRVINLKYILTIILVMMPILNIYACPGIAVIGLGEFLTLFFAFLVSILVKKERICIRNSAYWLFNIYLIFISLIFGLVYSTYSLSSIFTVSIRLLLYSWLIFCVTEELIDKELLKNGYIAICFAASVYLIIQFLGNIFLGKIMPITFSELNVLASAYTGREYSNNILSSVVPYSILFRPSGFFKEPAHFCQYTLYSLPLLITDKKRYKNHYFITAIILMAILISRSGMGYFAVALFFLMLTFSTQNRKTIKKRIVLAVLIVLFIFISVNLGLLDYAYGRFSTETGSGGIRILRGIIIFSKLPTLHKFIGIGLGNFASFVKMYGISTIYDPGGDHTNEYMSLISSIFINGGLVGASIFIYSFVDKWKRLSLTRKICCLIFGMFACCSNFTLYTAGCVLPMIFIFYELDSDANEKEK